MFTMTTLCISAYMFIYGNAHFEDICKKYFCFNANALIVSRKSDTFKISASNCQNFVCFQS